MIKLSLEMIKSKFGAKFEVRTALYELIHTENDVLRERYIFGSELSDFGFPKIPEIFTGEVGDLKSVPIQWAGKEKNPRSAILHHFTNDAKIEPVWANAVRYVEVFKWYKYVLAPDFSLYSDMPKPMQQWQIYRNRALTWFFLTSGVKMIPSVTWSGEESYDFCFDGLPKNSTLAVSTNGCLNKDSKQAYIDGFCEMCHRLEPRNVIVVGKPIEVPVDVEITYLNNISQELNSQFGKKKK